MKKLSLLSLVIGLFSFSAFSSGGYGDAGCGLGSVVFGSDPGFVQIFAATTNGTFGSQTFGISTGTSNCSGLGDSATQFIESNKTALSNDIARGQGETLASLSQIYGCSSFELGKNLRSNFGTLFNTGSQAKEIHSKIMNIIKEENISCNNLG